MFNSLVENRQHNRSKTSMRNLTQNMFGLVCLLILLSVKGGALQADKYNFCYKVGYSSNFEYGCCNGNPIELGIDFNSLWNGCAVPPEEAKRQDETLSQTMWRIYSCIVSTALNGTELTLSRYASVMAQTYPEEIKSKIFEIVNSSSLNISDLNPQKQLDAIRLTYHNIEKGVCTQNYKEASLKELGACSGPPDFSRAISFRGSCCSGEQLPIRLSFLRREPSQPVQDCTKALMVRAGSLSQSKAGVSGKSKKVTIRSFDERLQLMDSVARQMCLQTCTLELDIFNRPADYTKLPFDYNDFLAKVSKPFSESIKEKLRAEFSQDFYTTVDRMAGGAIPIIIESEFNGRSNQFLKQVITTCESHNAAVRAIERALYKICWPFQG